MEVSDFRNDVILAEACRNDVEMYCKDVEPGKLLDCLQPWSDMKSIKALPVAFKPALAGLSSLPHYLYSSEARSGSSM